MNESLQNKQLLHARIQTAILAFILVIATFGAVKVSSTTNKVNDLVDKSGKFLDEVDTKQLSGAVDSLSGAADSFSEAAEKIKAVDVDQVNSAVTAFTGAAEAVQELDVDHINSLISSLSTVTGALESVVITLQNAVSALQGLFSR